MKTDDFFQGMADTLKKGFDVGKAFGKPVKVQLIFRYFARPRSRCYAAWLTSGIRM